MAKSRPAKKPATVGKRPAKTSSPDRNPAANPLAAGFFALVKISPSERQARIDYIDAIRNGLLHSVGVTTEYRSALPRPHKPVMLKEGQPLPPPPPLPPAPEPLITRDRPIPPEALRSPGLDLDLENSSGSWRNSSTGSLFRFSNIIISWPTLVTRWPGIKAASTLEMRDPPGRKVEKDWEFGAILFGVLVYKGKIDPMSMPSKISYRKATEILLEEWAKISENVPADSTVRTKVGTWTRIYRQDE
jgi:hypothetical protein